MQASHNICNPQVQDFNHLSQLPGVSGPGRLQDGFFVPESNFGDTNQNMEMHHDRRKSSDFEHHRPSYLNPSPESHTLKNSIRYSDNHMEIRDSGMMMSMAPPMLSVGGGGPAFD